MMTGIPIENSLWTAYLLTIFFVVAGFAVYDVLYRRVPDRALVFFIPLAALAPVLQGYFLLNHGLPPLFLWPVATHALVGALLGFCIPLAAALATNGTGLGGGDIKFCGILGLVYGPSGMALVFLTAAVTAMPVIFLLRRLYRTGQPLAIPFLPFLACGCCTATLARRYRQLRAQSVCVFELSLEVSLQIIDLALIAVSAQRKQQLLSAELCFFAHGGDENITCGRFRDLHAVRFHQHQQSFLAETEADARDRRSADLLHQIIISAAAADSALRAKTVRHEFKGCFRVVVQPSDDFRIDDIWNADGIQILLQLLKCLFAVIT